MKFIKIFILLILVFTVSFINKYETKTIKTKNINIKTTENAVDRLKNIYNNNDIVGILKIKDTNYSWIITQTTDNDFYLKKDLLKKSYKGGNPFLDYRVSINNSNKLLIYGHNSRYVDMPFKILQNYYEKEYFDNNKYLILETDNRVNTYEIFSVYTETADFSYMTLVRNEKEWLEHLNYLKNKSIYKSDIDLNISNKILILQTCSTKEEYKKYKKKFLIIVAVRKEENEKIF